MQSGLRSTRMSVHRLGPALLAVGLPLVAFVLTLYPGVGDRQGTGDAIEYQLVGRILSIPHEPGYPQFVLLSHLWSYLPLPMTLATKINLLSAVFTIVAGLFFYRTAVHLGADTFSSILATWLLLLTPDVWRLSTQAEVYTLNLLWVSAVIWAALKWNASRRNPYLVALFLFYALSFGNHLTMITLLPALVFVVLATDAKVWLRWQSWMWAAAAVAAGMLQYGLLVWRSYHPHPALLPRFPLRAGPGELWDYVTGQRFVERHLLESGLEGWLPRFWEALVYSASQLTVTFALLCGFGAYLAWRRQRTATIFLALITVGVMSFAAAYNIKDSLLYTMPAWLSAGLLGAVGTSRLLERSRGGRAPLMAVGLIAVLALFAWRAVGLRVDDNPTALEPVLTAAEPGSGILAAFKQRRARLLRLYYRYGEVHQQAFELDFHAVNEAFAAGLEDVGDQPLYFRDPRAASQLHQSFVDHRTLPAESAGRVVYLNRPERPLTSVELRPLWNGSLAVTLGDRSVDLLGERALHLFLVSPHQNRSKGYRIFDTTAEADWAKRLDEALNVASPGDRFLLIANVLEAESRRELERLVDLRGVDLRTVGIPQRHTIAWWEVNGPAGEILVLRDLSDRLVLELDSPVSPSASRPTVN